MEAKEGEVEMGSREWVRCAGRRNASLSPPRHFQDIMMDDLRLLFWKLQTSHLARCGVIYAAN